MSTQKKNNRRKAVAVGLAVLGVAGLSLASAAQLNLTGSDAELIQAGVTNASAEVCQTSTIAVSFANSAGAPGSLTTGASFGYPAGVDSLVLSSIDSACEGRDVKVALGTSAGALVGTEASLSDVDPGALTLALNGANQAFGTLTAAQINSIAQVAVTIY
jgi:hypothetical protein